MQVRGDSPRGKREAERGRIKDLEKMERVGIGVKEKRKGGEMTKQTTCDPHVFALYFRRKKQKGV